MTLERYEEKRDFERTPEPAPVRAAGREGPLTFVVQKHKARRLHYDLRLELDGALKSWAVPGGPSLDPSVKRLAVMVEDHPLDYATFEGNIPAGEYGAGQVIVWDNGDYSPDEEGKLSLDDRATAEERMRDGLAGGKLSFSLRGHKLKGSWTLVKMKRGQNDWLLIKHRDAQADTSRDILKEDKSVLSGLTIEDIKDKKPPPPSATPIGPGGMVGARRGKFPGKISPMLAATGDSPFSDPAWLFEPKLDGYRIIASINEGQARLYSRNGNNVTTKYRGIVENLSRQPVSRALLDGEIIALDEKGRPCFQCLQGYLEVMGRKSSQLPEATAIIYYVFDIVYLDGYDLRNTPLIDRKRLLERVLWPDETIRLTDHFEGDGPTIYRAAVGQGLEGIIGKRKDSLYRPGQRSADWVKIKEVRTGDFVIGGFTEGTGNRKSTFGALILGYYDENGRLVPAGHIGTGFNNARLADLRKKLDKITVKRMPFNVEPELNGPATWVSPELVAEVKYSEWTRDGRLRVPVFLRTRDDKEPAEVHRPDVNIQDPPDPPNENKTPDTGNKAIDDILAQLEEKRDGFNLKVHDFNIKLTHLDKVLWPADDNHPSLTKRDLLVYLAEISPYILPHLRDHPLTLSRYPDGIRGEHFFQKHWNGEVPEFVTTVLLSEHGQKQHDYLICNNLPALLWLGQVADLELHTWFSRISPGPDIRVPRSVKDPGKADYLTNYPDFIIFDLDPYIYSGEEAKGEEPELNREGFARTGEAALWLKEILDRLKLPAYVKTSGKTGLHVFVPVLRQLDFHAVHAAARTICQYVLQNHAGKVTTEWAVEKRRGKVFFDYNQNARGKTLASIYSPRPAPGAPVSAPLRWEELNKIYPEDFTIKNTRQRIEQVGELWARITENKRDIKKILDVSEQTT